MSLSISGGSSSIQDSSQVNVPEIKESKVAQEFKKIIGGALSGISDSYGAAGEKLRNDFKRLGNLVNDSTPSGVSEVALQEAIFLCSKLDKTISGDFEAAFKNLKKANEAIINQKAETSYEKASGSKGTKEAYIKGWLEADKNISERQFLAAKAEEAYEKAKISDPNLSKEGYIKGWLEADEKIVKKEE